MSIGNEARLKLKIDVETKKLNEFKSKLLKLMDIDVNLIKNKKTQLKIQNYINNVMDDYIDSYKKVNFLQKMYNKDKQTTKTLLSEEVRSLRNIIILYTSIIKLTSVFRDNFQNMRELVDNIERGAATIGTLMLNDNPKSIEQLQNIMKEATGYTEKLLKLSSKVPATLSENIKIFQTIAPAARQVGMTYDQILKLTDMLAKSTMIFPGEFKFMIQVIDGLANGTYKVNSEYGRFLKTLGITPTKIREIKESGGDLFAYFEDHFKSLDTIVANSNNNLLFLEKQVAGQYDLLLYSMKDNFNYFYKNILKNTLEWMKEFNEEMKHGLTFLDKFAIKINWLGNIVRDLLGMETDELYKKMDWMSPEQYQSYLKILKEADKYLNNIVNDLNNVHDNIVKLNNTSIGTLVNGINDLQNELNKLQDKILDSQISIYEKRVKDIENKINNFNDKIEVMTKEIGYIAGFAGGKKYLSFNKQEDLKLIDEEIKKYKEYLSVKMGLKDAEKKLAIYQKMVMRDRRNTFAKEQVALYQETINILKSKIDEETRLKKQQYIQDLENQYEFIDKLKETADVEVNLRKKVLEQNNIEQQKVLKKLDSNLKLELKKVGAAEDDKYAKAKKHRLMLLKLVNDTFNKLDKEHQKYKDKYIKVINEIYEKEKKLIDKKERDKAEKERLKNIQKLNKVYNDFYDKIMVKIESSIIQENKYLAIEREKLKLIKQINRSKLDQPRKDELIGMVNSMSTLESQRVMDKTITGVNSWQPGGTDEFDEKRNKLTEDYLNKLRELTGVEQELQRQNYDVQTEEYQRFLEAKYNLDKKYVEAMNDINKQQTLKTIGYYQDSLNSFVNILSIMEQNSEKHSGTYKALLIAKAIADTYAAAVSALNGWDSFTTAEKIANFSLVLSTGFSAVAAIKSQKFHSGGYIDGLRSDEIPATLQTGEAVLSRQGVQNLVNGINNGSTGVGGVDVIIVNDMDEAIQKQLESRKGKAIIQNIAQQRKDSSR